MGEEGETAIVRAPQSRRIARLAAIALAVVLALGLLLVLGLNTGPGRRLIAERIGGYTSVSGLNIKVGRIEGSLYGRMILHDLRVSDHRGVFLTSPRVALDWRPFAYANNRIDVRRVVAPLVTLQRNPELVILDPNAPLLPDLDIDISDLAVERLVLQPAVSGKLHVLRLDGSAHVADARAQLSANAVALTGRGIAGGDRMRVRIDAVPDQNRLGIEARLLAPTGGVIASIGGLKAPLAAAISGNGDWKHWRGRATAALGGESLADLQLAADGGRFRVRGSTHPALYVAGSPRTAERQLGADRKAKPTPANPVATLTAPSLDVAIDATLANRRIDTRLQLRSDALSVRGQGLLDLGQSRYEQFAIDARLLQPGAILPNLSGRDVAARLVLDGSFGSPQVNYVLRAGSIGFGATRVDDIYASGIARVDAKHIIVPIRARARRVSGLNAAVGGLLDNVTIAGDLAISGDTILSDNLRIRSRGIDATAIVAADLSSGRYTGALNGRINDYRVESIGILNIQTNAKVVTVPGGGFGITGRVVARTSQIFNSGARSLLGGNAVVRADIGYNPNGVIIFRNLRLNAPLFRVTQGAGRYDPAGGVRLDANAYSARYGPLGVHISGTTAKPLILLRAARPGAGIGLVNLEARVRGMGNGYAVLAKGGTSYGPFTADLLVRTGAQLIVDIRAARFAGMDIGGRVQQTSAGPFAGRVTFAGSGVNGAAVLAAQGRVQRADIAATANAAKIPGAVDFTIGRATIGARIILYPNAPQVIADAQAADVRYGAVVLSTARAKIDYTNGSGSAQAVATGSNGVPFTIALNSRLSPSLWLVAAKGRANGIDFRTAAPARIAIDRQTYHLQPTRIDFGRGSTGGSARIAGSYGRGLTVQARLDALDLSVANAVVPDLGIGGSATGSLDFSQPNPGAFPQADLRLAISRFTRSSLTTVSEPVDMTVQGRLSAAGGDLRALVRRGPNVVGRTVVTLSPIPAGGSWSSRLLAAPLGGGIRYNGPAGVLFSLAGQSKQQLSGTMALAADLSGRLDAPRVNGVLRADKLAYENEIFGTRLSNMQLAGRFNNDRFELTRLEARAGEGTVSATGSVGLSSAAGFPIDIRARLNNARLARSDALGATATGDIAIINSKAAGGLIRGQLIIPHARYELIRQGQAEVAELQGVRRKGEAIRSLAQAAALSPGGFKLDLQLHADNQLFVSGMGLESEWRMNVRVGGTSAAPQVVGRADVVRGTYSFAGKRFNLDTGVIHFDGGPLADPQLSISASTTTNGVSVTINISGTGQNPRIAFTSTPALPQDEVLSRLLFGSSVTNLSAIEAIQLAAAFNTLSGGGGGLNPLGKLRSATGIDRLRILSADKASGRGTALSAGKYLTDDIYIEIITDSRGFTATQLQIALTRSLSLLSQAGSFGGSNVSLKYQKEF